ncbi:MAG TPA: transposase [Cyclobacteriaceae bacterium]|nr:transposase [Cyclobacteriaceae bacterium]
MAKQYKDYLSGYWQWNQLDHAEQWILFEDNMGEKLSIDEVALSEGELYTVVTNTEAHTQKGSLVAMVQGTRSQEVTALLQQIPRGKREEVKEITLDLAKNMELIAENSFPQADLVSDRFHVQQLPTEALQEMRIKYRWQAIDLENQLALQAREQGERYKPRVFSNGDTLKQLLARSRYLLFKTEKQWTQKQTQRAQILFDLFPDLKKAYQLTMMFRNIYQTAQSEQQALIMLNKWYQKIDKYGYESFITAANSIKLHQKTILNYFKNRSTNALAENFNGKIKAFRSVFRGITDVSFFLYRVSLIFA